MIYNSDHRSLILKKNKILFQFSFLIGLFYFIFSCKEQNKDLGKVSENETIIDSIKNGVNKFFYSDGILKSEVEYNEGMKSGKESIFYKSGNIKQVQYYFKGVLFGDRYWYNDYKKSIKYKFSNIEGVDVFELDFQDKIHLGKPIYQIFNKDVLTTRENFESLFYLAVPKKWEHKFLFEEIDENGRTWEIGEDELNSFYNKLEYAHVYLIKRNYKETGTYQIKATLLIEDNLSNWTISDSLIMDVIVK